MLIRFPILLVIILNKIEIIECLFDFFFFLGENQVHVVCVSSVTLFLGDLEFFTLDLSQKVEKQLELFKYNFYYIVNFMFYVGKIAPKSIMVRISDKVKFSM